MKNLLWLIAISCMVVLSWNIYPSSKAPIYELIIDFGNDAVFIHEVTVSKLYCEARVKFLKRENTKAYCIRRG